MSDVTCDQPGMVRVYRKEPQIVFVTPEHTVAKTAADEAVQFIKDNLEGRVDEADVKAVISDISSEPADGIFVVEVTAFLPTLKGEFRDTAAARQWLCRQRGWDHCDVEVILKDSRRDHEIRSTVQRLHR